MVLMSKRVWSVYARINTGTINYTVYAASEAEALKEAKTVPLVDQYGEEYEGFRTIQSVE